MRYGCRAHDIGQWTADTLAARLAAKGIQSIQLAPFKAISFTGALASHAASIGDALRKNHIVTAVVGCYINPINPNPQVREQSIETFFDYLGCVHQLNGNLVGLETGTPTVDYTPTPLAHTEEAFMDMVRTLERLVEKAETLSETYIGIEAVHCHTVSTAKKMKRLIQLLASPRVRVIFDPVNLIDSSNALNQKDLFAEYVDLLHDTISVVHVKPHHNALDTEAAYGWIRKTSQDLDILLEEVPESELVVELAKIRAQTFKGNDNENCSHQH
ncbi:MAG: TIM barrel protein [bacterium]